MPAELIAKIQSNIPNRICSNENNLYDFVVFENLENSFNEFRILDEKSDLAKLLTKSGAKKFLQKVSYDIINKINKNGIFRTSNVQRNILIEQEI